MIELSPGEIDPKLPGVVVISHGALCRELVRSAEMICGEMKNVSALGVEPGEDIELYRARLSQVLDGYPAGVFVLADLTCGTPFNSLMAVSAGREVYGIAGANLAVLMEAAMLREDTPLPALNAAAETSIHASISNLREFQAELMSAQEEVF